ncbi:hypothetical protein [Flavobacterium sp.]|uniref:hypothetical protein n=1 Tax=Flavobacterium sp. TaxID=239 RepID=UPI0025BF7AC0|nr:hypothetical protein [Flavobacterium sp.]MBA4155639.1 hypothetical protein [Flavobacterium sp.]
MEQYHYTCQYCGKEYKPNRRKKQKYCSNSCRTRAYQLRTPKLGSTVPQVEKKPESVKIDKISKAGVGNAFLGALLADGVQTLAKKVFENEDDKAATKKDFKEMKELLLSRYHRVYNLPPNGFGQLPYYDLNTKTIVYLKG